MKRKVYIVHYSLIKEMELKWTCKICGKVIFSTSKGQEEYNTQKHMEKHKRKEEVKNAKRKEKD